MEKGSVAICFVHGALAGVRARGLDVDPILRSAGISPELLRVRDARVSAAQYGTLWRRIAVVLDDEFFGQDSRRMKVGSFAMICHSVVHAGRLGAALLRTLRFLALFLDDFEVRLECDGAVARLVLHERHGGPVRVFGHETLLIMLHGLMCWLAGRRIAILKAEFAYPEPVYSREYRVMYSTVLQFERERTAIDFDAAMLELPVTQSERTVRRFLRGAPTNIIVKYKNVEGMAARVRRELKRTPADAWPDFDAMAAMLLLTPSTLRRRLEQEGQSYRTIKEQLRRDLAIDWLVHSRRSVLDIALELGFAEPSAFHRAFRAWTGSAPGEYRRRAGDHADVSSL